MKSLLALVLLIGAAPALAQVTQRVSVSNAGLQGNEWSVGSAISADGRFVAFSSLADNLVPGDTNGVEDVFVRDRLSGTTERASVSSGGVEQLNGNSSVGLAISSDGRFVAFTSPANNLVPGDTNLQPDVFVRDRTAGTTERVSVDSTGAQGNADCLLAAMSADGRFVVFGSRSTNLVTGDANGHYDIFLRDRLTGTTERVSVASTGTEGNGDASRARSRRTGATWRSPARRPTS
jgi:hypothetical protein